MYLLPPSPRDWLPGGHLVFFILDVIQELDLSAIEAEIQSKDPRGEQPYNPWMMVALLLYGYSVGIFSSRKLEKACYEDVAFHVLCGGCQPYYTTINDFRKRHLTALRKLFLQTLKLCKKAGMVKLGHVALDGTKIQGNASKHKAMSYEHMLKTELRLKKEIAELLDNADKVDAREDQQFGKDRRGDELPEELARRESRLVKIKKAKKELEKEARLARAERLRDQARRAEKRAKTHTNPIERKRAGTVASKKKRQAEELELRDEDDPNAAPPFVTDDGLEKHRPRVRQDGTPHPKAQRNFSDPDSRIMESGGSFLQGYNCQIAVDDKNQVIVGQAVTNKCPDNANLLPLLSQVIENCETAPKKLTADAGYWNRDAPKAAKVLGTEVFISPRRRKHVEVGNPPTPASLPTDASDLERMRYKLQTEEGRAVYARRKAIVEPVHGQIKEARGFRRFLLRGLRKVSAEFALICATHNLLKLFRSGLRPAV